MNRSYSSRVPLAALFLGRLGKRHDAHGARIEVLDESADRSTLALVKFWFSISRDEQLARFKSRGKNPLKQWKLSPLDGRAQGLWDAYTKYKELVLSRTHTSYSPWIIVKANNKKRARLSSIRYVLSLMDYDGKDQAEVSLLPDPNIVTRYYRNAAKID